MPENNGNGKKLGAVIGVLKFLARPWTNGYVKSEDIKDMVTIPYCCRIHSTTEAALDRLTAAADNSTKTVLKSSEETREVLRLFQLKIDEGRKDFEEKILELHRIKADKK